MKQQLLPNQGLSQHWSQPKTLPTANYSTSVLPHTFVVHKLRHLHCAEVHAVEVTLLARHSGDRSPVQANVPGPVAPPACMQ